MGNSMFRDDQTNTVYVTESLKREYPEIFCEICSVLSASGLNLIVNNKAENKWSRDWMPLQVGDRYVKFLYKGYGGGYSAYPFLKIDKSAYNFLPNVKNCNIVLDGGNCQRYNDKAIISEIVFKHNPSIEKVKLIKRLERVLQSDVIIIPVEPGDELGHTDGIVKFIPGNICDKDMVFLNDYSVMKSSTWSRYEETVRNILFCQDVECIPFTYAYHKCPKMSLKQFRKKYPMGDDYNPAWGYFINFLMVKDIIFLPVFGISGDEKSVALLERYCPNFKVKKINCSKLSIEGGLLNCISMNYKV